MLPSDRSDPEGTTVPDFSEYRSAELDKISCARRGRANYDAERGCLTGHPFGHPSRHARVSDKVFHKVFREVFRWVFRKEDGVVNLSDSACVILFIP